MSYKGFKRVLGETNLERKCRILFGLCLFALITGSFWWYGTNTEGLVTKQNQIKGELLVRTSLIQKHWEKFEATHWKQSETNPEFVPVMKEISANLQLLDYESGFIRPGVAEGPLAPADEYEQQVLTEFQQPLPAPPITEPGAPEPAPVLRFRERSVNGGEGYQYFQGVYATKSGRCVECHRVMTGPADLAEGDLIAVAKVSISNGPTNKDLATNRAILFSAAIVTVFLAMIASYVIVKYIIVKPLKHLRDVSDAVSRGNIDQRAEIQTGDEFEELGTAFNRMLRHLVTVQEEIKQANSNLDVKVDQLAQLNMQLFEMNRLKSDFLATMSHELRTPLNSIIGFSDVLGSISSLDDKQKRYVNNIQKSGRVLLDMINDILDLAKIESGKMDLRLSDFRIEQVISAQCDMARPLTEKKNIDLVTEVAPRLPELHQDQGKIQQILNNLLSNAIKFTPEGGRILIAARRGADDMLNLVVEDTGVGIAEEDQVYIFEKFRQGNTVLPGGDAMTREFSGTGLGLSIVKELCKLLGGEITLQSELGKGSVFTVHLPWSLAAVPRSETPLAEELAAMAHRHPETDHSLVRSTP